MILISRNEHLDALKIQQVIHHNFQERERTEGSGKGNIFIVNTHNDIVCHISHSFCSSNKK